MKIKALLDSKYLEDENNKEFINTTVLGDIIGCMSCLAKIVINIAEKTNNNTDTVLEAVKEIIKMEKE